MPVKNIVAILSYDSLRKEKKGRDYLQRLRESNKLVDMANDKPASLVVTFEEAYLSCISTSTLMSRSRQSLGKLNLLHDIVTAADEDDGIFEEEPE